ncbi:MAG: hypothetical protein Q7O66_22035, partial [Dehalococcoidia bacterium]|nr:hypothetical protein [Dehalococcoidia bacterium]
ALSHLRAGLAALAGHPSLKDRPEVADLHFERFYIRDRLGDIAGMAETIAELQSLANRLGSPRAEAEASLVTAIFRMWQNDLTGACEGALHAVKVSESAQELTICCLAYRTLTSIGLRLGDHHFMRRYAKNALAVTQRLGAPSMEIRSHVLLAWADFLAGAWDESRRVSIEAIALARRVGSTRDLVYSIAGNALLLSLQGNLPAAEARIAEAKAAFNSGTPADRAVFGRIEIAETALTLELGEGERALNIAKGFTRQSVTGTAERAPAGLTVAYEPIGLALLAEAQVATGDLEGALKTASELFELRGTGSQYVTALSYRAEGLARQALGQREVAIECLTKANEIFSELEIPFEAARSLLDLGAAASDTKPEVAIRVVQESLTVFERLGARRHIERARRLLRSLGVSPPP